MEDIDLDEFVASVLGFDESQDNPRFLKVPQLVAMSSFEFPLLMKTEPDKRESSPKSTDCRKCQTQKEQLEERIRILEMESSFYRDQLFELYSHLNSKVDLLLKRQNGN
jgi:hypothetical protein